MSKSRKLKLKELEGRFGIDKMKRVLNRERVVSSMNDNSEIIFQKALRADKDRLSTLDVLVIMELGNIEYTKEVDKDTLTVMSDRHLTHKIRRLDNSLTAETNEAIKSANLFFKKQYKE